MFDEFPAQKPPEEALDRLHVVSAENPAEVVVQLKVSRRAVGCLHRSDEIRAFVVFAVEKAVENVAETGHVMEIVQNDDLRQVWIRGR